MQSFKQEGCHSFEAAVEGQLLILKVVVMSAASTDIAIEAVNVSAYTVPTTSLESDGTFEWNSTTMVVVEIAAGGRTGTGYSYADVAAAHAIRGMLAAEITGLNVLDIPALWVRMMGRVRNAGRPGIASMGISAVDVALWDLKGRLFGKAVLDIAGAAHEAIEAYGSGGFTSYSDSQIEDQLGGWARQGLPAVKMKIGREPDRDLHRVGIARQAIGDHCRLFVDANGAYTRKQALWFAERFKDYGVQWFEEPVSADDLAGLHLLRNRMPGDMDVVAGEYGYDNFYFRRMLEHQAVDILQADATRCGGVTGYLAAAATADAFGMRLSAHTAPLLHAHVACITPRSINVEYFHDHAAIETRFFDGAICPSNGLLRVDRTRPGFGWELKRKDAEPFRVL
jgi:L-alanine-DL-glutamate epimerase-like enolase superfamily enzyme